jgi:hypothetical protein
MGIAKSSNLRGIVLSITLLTGLSSLSQARSLQFSTGVTPKQIAQLNTDLSVKTTLPDEVNTERVMGISSLSDAALKQWLSQRIGYVVGENDVEDVGGIQKFKYPDKIFPDFEMPKKGVPTHHAGPRGPASVTESGDTPTVVMANIGTSYYYTGKYKDILVGYRFKSTAGEQIVPVLSPRVGILKVGEGLFEVPYPEKPNSIVNTWYRLITLYHEAHHSDGNGKSLGFPHAVCPEGHEYYNYNACDREVNGAYGVEAFLLRQVMLNCVANKTCDASEAELLGRMVNDAASRLLARNFLDPRPEGITVAGVSSGN